MAYILARADFPGVNCEDCATALQEGAQEPACIEGQCPVGIDRLPEEALRILEIRGLLVSLGDIGLAPMISREFGLTLDDMHLLAWIEEQLRKLQPAKEGEK